jgi:hypothetical protein
MVPHFCHSQLHVIADAKCPIRFGAWLIARRCVQNFLCQKLNRDANLSYIA